MTYIIGIDIAKYTHTCRIINHHNEVIVESFNFDNNFNGFKILGSILDSLDSNNLKIGFESTGNYGHNLKNFLIKSGYDFMEIHPVLIKRFAKARSLRKTKTDKVDVSMICSYLNLVDFKSYSKKSYHNAPFKSLVRSRDKLLKYINGASLSSLSFWVKTYPSPSGSDISTKYKSYLKSIFKASFKVK